MKNIFRQASFKWVRVGFILFLISLFLIILFNPYLKFTWHIKEKVRGETPDQKLQQLFNSIKNKNQSQFEAIFPDQRPSFQFYQSIDENNHATDIDQDLPYELTESVTEAEYELTQKNNVLETMDFKKFRDEIRGQLWNQSITMYEIIDRVYYTQPCCGTGWNSILAYDWAGMARYTVMFKDNSGNEYRYHIEITVKDPEWKFQDVQKKTREWVVTNISDKELPKLYEGI